MKNIKYLNFCVSICENIFFNNVHLNIEVTFLFVLFWLTRNLPRQILSNGNLASVLSLFWIRPHFAGMLLYIGSLEGKRSWVVK